MPRKGIFACSEVEHNPWKDEKQWSLNEETEHLLPTCEEWKVKTETLKMLGNQSILENLFKSRVEQETDSEIVGKEMLKSAEDARQRSGRTLERTLHMLFIITRGLSRYKFPSEEPICLDDCIVDKFLCESDNPSIIERGAMDLKRLRSSTPRMVEKTPLTATSAISWLLSFLPYIGEKIHANAYSATIDPPMCTSYEINEHQHRFLYKDLHFEVIEMLRAVGFSLNSVTSTNQEIMEEAIGEFLKSAQHFVKKVQSVIYIENNMELIPDEIIYGRILPYLWAEFNDKNVRHRFACGYNIGEEVRQQVFAILYKAVHKILMQISSIYTIVCLDYLTIIDEFSDIEKAILVFRTKLEETLQMGFVYFVAMVNRDEVMYSMPNAPKEVNCATKHVKMLKETQRVCNDIQAVLVIAHTLKLFYETSINLTGYEVAVTGPGETAKLTNLQMDSKIYADPVINDLSVKLSKRRSLCLRSLSRSLAEDYVNIPIVQALADDFVEDGTQLQNFLIFGKLMSCSGRSKQKLIPATVVLQPKKYKVDAKALEPVKELVIPPQFYSVDTYELKFSGWYSADKISNPGYQWGYQPAWRHDLIKAMTLKGFVGLKTVVELQVLETDSKNFWENNGKVRDSVLEQFALGVVVKDNAVRHRTWRNTNLARALESRRFLECNMDNFFTNHSAPAIHKQYEDTVRNLSSKLFWFETYKSDDILKILFPVPWWDKMASEHTQRAAYDTTIEYRLKQPLQRRKKTKPSRFWIRGDIPMRRTIARQVLPLGRS